jgi:hypothetical protein
MPDTRRLNDSLFRSTRHCEPAHYGANGLLIDRPRRRKGRGFSLRDTRNASSTPNNEGARGRIDRVHNRSSRATTGPKPGLRSRQTPKGGYEHRVNSRNNEAPAWISRNGHGSSGGDEPSAFFRWMAVGARERLVFARPHSLVCLALWARWAGNSVEARLCWKGTDLRPVVVAAEGEVQIPAALVLVLSERRRQARVRRSKAATVLPAQQISLQAFAVSFEPMFF